MQATARPSTHAAVLMALAFLILEGPCRILLQPDPWLLHPDHWYFQQPLRLGLEALLVALAAWAIGRLRPDLLRWNPAHGPLALGGILGALLLFGLLESEQLQDSLSLPGSTWLPWLATGALIGIGQELAFRGLLFSALQRWLSTRVAAWATTTAFVLAPLHAWRLGDFAEQGALATVAALVALYFAFGTFFQWLRQHTGGVIVPAMVHGAGNAVTWVAVFA